MPGELLFRNAYKCGNQEKGGGHRKAATGVWMSQDVKVCDMYNLSIKVDRKWSAGRLGHLVEAEETLI